MEEFLRKKIFRKRIYPFIKILFISLITLLLIKFEPEIQDISHWWKFGILVLLIGLLQLIIEYFNNYLNEKGAEKALGVIVKEFGHQVFNNKFDKVRFTIFEEEISGKKGNLKILKRINGEISDTKWNINSEDINSCEGMAGRAWYQDKKVLRSKVKSRTSTQKKADQIFISQEKYLERMNNGSNNPDMISSTAIKLIDGTKYVLVVDSEHNVQLPSNSSMLRFAALIKIILEEV